MNMIMELARVREDITRRISFSFVKGEDIVLSYQGEDNYVFFTNLRIVTVYLPSTKRDKMRMSTYLYDKILDFRLDTTTTNELTIDIAPSKLEYLIMDFTLVNDLLDVYQYISSQVLK